jgi:hypothetical protein
MAAAIARPIPRLPPVMIAVGGCEIGMLRNA